MWSFTYRPRLNNCAMTSREGIYTYHGGPTTVSGHSVLSLSSDRAGHVLGQGGAILGGCPPVPLNDLQRCEFFPVRFWHGRQGCKWFSPPIGLCLAIAAFTLLFQGQPTPRFFSSPTLPSSRLMCCCVSFIGARQNTPLAMLAVFKERRMSYCSSCIWHPSPDILSDVMKS